MQSQDIALSKKKSTKRALIWSNILSEPLFTLYLMVSFLLYKDLGASPLLIILLNMLKPVVTMFSFYWSSGLAEGTKRLKSNVVWAGVWMRAPFLLCPWIDSPWFLLAAAVNYMFFYRAAAPAWLEILRRNLGKEERGRSFAWSSALGYCEGVVLSLAMGSLLDHNSELWKSFLCGAALIGLITVFVQNKISVDGDDKSVIETLPLKERLIRPWKDSYELLRKRSDFAAFQWGFMICGFGLMLIQPALAFFMVDTLGISYFEFAAAISIAKGLGFAASSPWWSRLLEKMDISKLASFVFVFIGLFPLVLALSVFDLTWLYIAYFIYGIGQGGSHLVWNLSGPTFAGKEDSSRYTGVGIVLAGLRGGIAPPLGGLLASVSSPLSVLLCGGALCCYSGAFFWKAIAQQNSKTKKLTVR